MTTYIIQFQGEGHITWSNYCSDDGFMVEFLSADAAKTVGHDLCAAGAYRICQVKDSHGTVYI